MGKKGKSASHSLDALPDVDDASATPAPSTCSIEEERRGAESSAGEGFTKPCAACGCYNCVCRLTSTELALARSRAAQRIAEFVSDDASEEAAEAVLCGEKR